MVVVLHLIDFGQTFFPSPLELDRKEEALLLHSLGGCTLIFVTTSCTLKSTFHVSDVLFGGGMNLNVIILPLGTYLDHVIDMCPRFSVASWNSGQEETRPFDGS